ncbi:MAG: heavy metal translocating P-type ATPase [bacterium]|nr:heavy metal translocating P-type ATPase [bacterium]
MQDNIPKGIKCEHCGMVAEYAEKDAQGVTHYYCSHHVPMGANNESIVNSRISNSEIRKFGSHSQLAPHDKHAGHSVNMFKTRFWLCLVLTIPILAYADVVQKLFRIQLPEFPGHMYATLVLASVIFFYGGWVFIKGALAELKHRLPGMMTLITLAIVTAYAYSVVATFTPIGEPLFWEIATLITIMLLGHWIEMAAVGHASGALRELAKLLPDTAERFQSRSAALYVPPGGTQGPALQNLETVPVAELRVGDLVLVRPGTKIPADGEIAEGISSVNESMISGESKPVDKKSGSQVIAGTVNGEGALKVRVTKIGENTALAGIMRLVSEAQASRSRVQVLADKAAFALTIIAVSVGAVTVFAWLYLGAGIAVAMTRLVAVLVIACPHALGVAVPLVSSISTTLSARNGLLIRNKLALEMARKINVVLFDKTGTLTKGEYGVTDILVGSQLSEEKVLALAAAVDRESEHPIAKAIVRVARQRAVAVPNATEVKALPGRGVEGMVDGKKIMVGGENLVRELQADTSKLGSLEVLHTQGKTVVYLIIDRAIVAAFGVADIIREESREAVDALHRMGIKVAMVTGDAAPVARWVAKEIGIDEYFSEVLPAQKVEKVQELQKRGMRVAMVGDGINDAPALTAADVGIAIGAGTDVAIESAGIVLIKNDPRDIVKIITLARATYRKMVENLIWATGYNAFAIPAAAGAFISFGIILAPAFAAVLMSVSTVIVAFNAQLLRRLKI